jgi:hypothetical protein
VPPSELLEPLPSVAVVSATVVSGAVVIGIGIVVVPGSPLLELPSGSIGVSSGQPTRIVGPRVASMSTGKPVRFTIIDPS